jgi:hypothetical protein
MNVTLLEKAAAKFGQGIPVIQSFGTGLINNTYKVNFPDGKTILLQCINQTTFRQPENIIHNYRLISDHLRRQGKKSVPALVQTIKGKYFWLDEEENFWRATDFIKNSYAKNIATSASEVFLAAKSFAEFSTSLIGLDPVELEIIIPKFHNLAYRYQQFEQSIQQANIKRLLKATHVISELRERYPLVDFYEIVEKHSEDYPVRIMHHDCKISNILFNLDSNEVICPVDLDTVMPGKFYSDVGDMVRTMACTKDENSTEWEAIDINSDYYDAIIRGYLAGTENNLTEKELAHIHMGGQILIYMQSLRFVTDFLNNDIYYKTQYPEQNLNRALNQLILLEKLENLLEEGKYK